MSNIKFNWIYINKILIFLLFLIYVSIKILNNQ